MQFAIDIALSLIYFGLFLLLCAWSWRFWIMYKNQKFLNDLSWVMLEIKLPREIEKSPFATEVALTSLLQTGGMGTKWHRLFAGNLPQFASLEIASIEGVIHFYVRVHPKYRLFVESNFYAQYPGIEIVEAEDYTRLIRYHHLSKDVKMFGARYKLAKTWTPYDMEKGEAKKYSMPADFLPIKTYVDYGLDKNPKPENAVDPMAAMIEFMGNIGKGEHFWFQMILTDEGNFNGKKMPKLYVDPETHIHANLEDMAKTYKEELKITGFNPKGSLAKDEYGLPRQKQIGRDADGNPIMVDIVYQETVPKAMKKEADLTQDDKADIEAINKKLSKPRAHVVIRLMYIAKSEAYNGQNVFKILGWGKPFAGANSFGFTTSEPYDYNWQNWRGRRVPWRGEEMFEAYVEREGFFPHIQERPWLDKREDDLFWGSSMAARKTFRMLIEAFFYPFEHPNPSDVTTLNLEEIATIWHMPSSTITTPTLPRIESNKGVAPVNLPQ